MEADGRTATLSAGHATITASIDAPATARFEVVTPVILTGNVRDQNLWALLPFPVSAAVPAVAFLVTFLQVGFWDVFLLLIKTWSKNKKPSNAPQAVLSSATFCRLPAPLSLVC